MMDLASLLDVVKAQEWPLLFLIGGLLATIPAISAVLGVSLIGHVDLPIVLLLLWGPLAAGLKELSPGFECLDACVRDCEQISHRLGFLHGDLLHDLDVTDSITEGVDDLDVLDVRDSIPGIAKIFHVVPEALIILLSDGLESLRSRWTLVRALEVPDEHGRLISHDLAALNNVVGR
jgi:hypothetical protein